MPVNAMPGQPAHRVDSTPHNRHAGPTVPTARLYQLVKLVLEYILAGVLFVLAAPVIGVTALLVKLTSPGPAFYWQTRTGRYGKPYLIYKIRTMVQDCERLTGPCWSRPGDPRITPLGRFLRRTHLDELPQLWNVLRGEMSLVGPRPERPEIIHALEHAIPSYRARLSVRPGITGLAQVNLPPDTDVASVQHKVLYDLYYIRRLSLWLDLRILLRTALDLLGLPKAARRAVLHLHLPEATSPAGQPAGRVAAQAQAVA